MMTERAREQLAAGAPYHAVARTWRFNWRRWRWEYGFWIYLRGLDGLDEWHWVREK